MPSLSFSSLDRLIEPASSSPSSQAGPSTDRSTPFSFYPPLYATPPQQRPPSPSAFSPSPYVLNFKRRAPVQQHQQNGGKENIAVNSADLYSQQQLQRTDVVQGQGRDAVLPERNRVTKNADENGAPKRAHEAFTENEVFEIELEKRDVSPYRNRSFSKNNQSSCNHSSVSSDHGTADAFTASFPNPFPVANEDVEFFDAPDSVFSDSTTEDDFGSTRVTPGRSFEGWSGRAAARLAEEVERRRTAEENVALWQRRWNQMAKRCVAMGVSLSFEAENLLRNEGGSLDALDQELLVARLVGDAIARAVVRAEKDEEFEQILGVKNREISRLWDKLQYLELVNREMSQRNQEVTELAQRRKKRRQRRRKLALTGFCAAFLMGTAGLLSFKYVPWDQAKSWATALHKSPAVEIEST